MDRREFESLTMPHLDAVYRMAVQLDSRPHGAAHLAEDTYLHALQADRFDHADERRVRLRLFKILYRLVRRNVVRSGGRTTAHGNGGDQYAGPERTDQPPFAADLETLDWNRLDELIDRTIPRMPQEHRVLLFLWSTEGLAYGELAVILDTTIESAANRLGRARNNLVARLAESSSRKAGRHRWDRHSEQNLRESKEQNRPDGPPDPDRVRSASQARY